MTIRVREGTPGDDPYIDALGELSAQTSVSPLRNVSQDQAALSFRSLRLSCRGRRGALVLVAERDGSRAGFLILLTDVPDEVTRQDQAFIAYMAVGPEYRRQGLGQALLDAAQAQAAQRRLPHISLMVTGANLHARSLYSKFGFAEERILMTKSTGAR
ncbi:MAG: GNAT family N-acetyltransferase [Candidatus Eremiobacteraeota bacterium]|nr:GNAT family N-acetyltransferase [Candidatus Eremiobacteraeota bacterium]